MDHENESYAITNLFNVFICSISKKNHLFVCLIIFTINCSKAVLQFLQGLHPTPSRRSPPDCVETVEAARGFLSLFANQTVSVVVPQRVGFNMKSENKTSTSSCSFPFDKETTSVSLARLRTLRRYPRCDQSPPGHSQALAWPLFLEAESLQFFLKHPASMRAVQNDPSWRCISPLPRASCLGEKKGRLAISLAGWVCSF